MSKHPKDYIRPIIPAAIQWKEDGTPWSSVYDDVYFSRDGGRDETTHVFLGGNNLIERFKNLNGHFTICETGFGTGLNFLCAVNLFLANADASAFLHFISIEKHPISPKDLDRLYQSLDPDLKPHAARLLDIYPPLVPGQHTRYFSDRIKLTLLFGDVTAMLPILDKKVDAWFLDGFSPAKNPDMWGTEVYHEMARLSHAGTTLATFTVARAVVDGLAQQGFHLDKVKGFAHKREMLIGRFKNVSRETFSLPKSVTIIGAGLAGTATAYHLARAGIPVTLYEKGPVVASGASGSKCGLVYPRLTADITKEGTFYLEAYVYALHHYRQLGLGTFAGVLRQGYNEQDKTRYKKILETWRFPESFCKAMGDDLFYVEGGVISPQAVCKAHVEAYPDLITLKLNSEIIHIDPETPTIITAGIGSCGLAAIDLQPSRGQVTYAEPLALKHAVTYDGYAASTEDFLCIGSTYQRDETDTALRPQDDDDNIARFQKYLSHLPKPSITGSWSGIRAATPQRFPLVKKLGPNLFVNTGHGSYGLTSTPLCGEIILSQVRP